MPNQETIKDSLMVGLRGTVSYDPSELVWIMYVKEMSI